MQLIGKVCKTIIWRKKGMTSFYGSNWAPIGVQGPFVNNQQSEKNIIFLSFSLSWATKILYRLLGQYFKKSDKGKIKIVNIIYT